MTYRSRLSVHKKSLKRVYLATRKPNTCAFAVNTMLSLGEPLILQFPGMHNVTAHLI